MMIGRNGTGFMQLNAGDADFDFYICFVSFPGRVLVDEQPFELLKAFMWLNPHYANKIYVKKKKTVFIFLSRLQC